MNTTPIFGLIEDDEAAKGDSKVELEDVVARGESKGEDKENAAKINGIAREDVGTAGEDRGKKAKEQLKSGDILEDDQHHLKKAKEVKENNLHRGPTPAATNKTNKAAGGKAAGETVAKSASIAIAKMNDAKSSTTSNKAVLENENKDSSTPPIGGAPSPATTVGTSNGEKTSPDLPSTSAGPESSTATTAVAASGSVTASNIVPGTTPPATTAPHLTTATKAPPQSSTAATTTTTPAQLASSNAAPITPALVLERGNTVSYLSYEDFIVLAGIATAQGKELKCIGRLLTHKQDCATIGICCVPATKLRRGSCRPPSFALERAVLSENFQEQLHCFIDNMGYKTTDDDVQARYYERGSVEDQELEVQFMCQQFAEEHGLILLDEDDEPSDIGNFQNRISGSFPFGRIDDSTRRSGERGASRRPSGDKDEENMAKENEQNESKNESKLSSSEGKTDCGTGVTTSSASDAEMLKDRKSGAGNNCYKDEQDEGGEGACADGNKNIKQQSEDNERSTASHREGSKQPSHSRNKNYDPLQDNRYEAVFVMEDHEPDAALAKRWITTFLKNLPMNADRSNPAALIQDYTKKFHVAAQKLRLRITLSELQVFVRKGVDTECPDDMSPAMTVSQLVGTSVRTRWCDILAEKGKGKQAAEAAKDAASKRQREEVEEQGGRGRKLGVKRSSSDEGDIERPSKGKYGSKSKGKSSKERVPPRVLGVLGKDNLFGKVDHRRGGGENYGAAGKDHSRGRGGDYHGAHGGKDREVLGGKDGEGSRETAFWDRAEIWERHPRDHNWDGMLGHHCRGPVMKLQRIKDAFFVAVAEHLDGREPMVPRPLCYHSIFGHVSDLRHREDLEKIVEGTWLEFKVDKDKNAKVKAAEISIARVQRSINKMPFSLARDRMIEGDRYIGEIQRVMPNADCCFVSRHYRVERPDSLYIQDVFLHVNEFATRHDAMQMRPGQGVEFRLSRDHRNAERFMASSVRVIDSSRLNADGTYIPPYAPKDSGRGAAGTYIPPYAPKDSGRGARGGVSTRDGRDAVGGGEQYGCTREGRLVARADGGSSYNYSPRDRNWNVPTTYNPLREVDLHDRPRGAPYSARGEQGDRRGGEPVLDRRGEPVLDRREPERRGDEPLLDRRLTDRPHGPLYCGPEQKYGTSGVSDLNRRSRERTRGLPTIGSGPGSSRSAAYNSSGEINRDNIPRGGGGSVRERDPPSSTRDTLVVGQRYAGEIAWVSQDMCVVDCITESRSIFASVNEFPNGGAEMRETALVMFTCGRHESGQLCATKVEIFRPAARNGGTTPRRDNFNFAAPAAPPAQIRSPAGPGQQERRHRSPRRSGGRRSLPRGGGERTTRHGDRGIHAERGDRTTRHGDRTTRHGDRTTRHGDRTTRHGNIPRDHGFVNHDGTTGSRRGDHGHQHDNYSSGAGTSRRGGPPDIPVVASRNDLFSGDYTPRGTGSSRGTPLHGAG
ncbi:unnamed protein product, partial [Amoebophrya sp. A25]|eukprot:GSA25T00017216001.1